MLMGMVYVYFVIVGLKRLFCGVKQIKGRSKE